MIRSTRPTLDLRLHASVCALNLKESHAPISERVPVVCGPCRWAALLYTKRARQGAAAWPLLGPGLTARLASQLEPDV
jgi:hypothetical protein